MDFSLTYRSGRGHLESLSCYQGELGVYDASSFLPVSSDTACAQLGNCIDARTDLTLREKPGKVENRRLSSRIPGSGQLGLGPRQYRLSRFTAGEVTRVFGRDASSPRARQDHDFHEKGRSWRLRLLVRGRDPFGGSLQSGTKRRLRPVHPFGAHYVGKCSVYQGSEGTVLGWNASSGFPWRCWGERF